MDIPRNPAELDSICADDDSISILSNYGLDGAAILVERILEMESGNWEAWSAKADILYLRGKYFNALECCDRALMSNAKDALTWNTKGNILYKLGRYDEAIYCYNQSIIHEPMFMNAWHNKRLAIEVQLKEGSRKISMTRTVPSRDGDEGGDGSLRAVSRR